MVGDDDGLFVRGTAAETKQKLDASCLRMKNFKTMVTTAMLANSLDTMLDTVHRRERVKHGLPVDQLSPGDVVFDSVGFRETASICGNICRVLQMGASGNHCLLGKANMRHSVSKEQAFPQIAISRPSNYLHFIAKGSNDNVLIGENVNFDIVKYLPGTEPRDNAHLWTLPPPPVIEIPDDVPAAAAAPTPAPADAASPAATAAPATAPAPAPRLAQAAEIVAVTRKGRTVRRPKHFRQ